MSSKQRRKDAIMSERSANSASSRRSADSYESRSTAPTSLHESPASSMKYATSKPRRQPSAYSEDLSPSTSLYPRSSVETYSSEASSYRLQQEEDLAEPVDYSEIPPLPTYHKEIVEPNVSVSTPEGFAELFPSMNRLSIRHDDFTPDGNMNLRVDTVVQGRRKKTIQLFHLRMYDLAKREFSLRRYCRDSGREVCNSKRKFVEPTATQSRPKLQRSMSSAMKNLAGRPQLRRAGTGGSIFSTKSRPSTSHSTAGEGDDELASNFDALSISQTPKSRPQPTNCIKLEFSNYARVDVQRKGSGHSKRYDFEWWGHKYSWKRVVEKHLDMVSFHLMRDGSNAPVAHIVPETRSPNQVEADETAGGWVPPCHMWISDESIVNAMTDVADVIMSTGLIALVDDCIKIRWQHKKVRRLSLPLTSRSVDVEYVGPKAFVQHMFSRQNSAEHDSQSYRHANPVAAAY